MCAVNETPRHCIPLGVDFPALVRETVHEMASFTLETATGGQARQFQFDAPNVSIGRDRSADFTLDHPTVSRQHAVVAWDGNAFKLVILSRGGLTAIDGQQVGGEVPLYNGSQLMFGQLAFVFRSEAAPPKPAGAYQGGQAGAQSPVYGQGQYPVASVTGMHATNTGMYQAAGQGPSPDSTADFRSLSGQFPSLAEHEQLAKQPAPMPNSDGLMSWEQIAATADQVPEAKDALTDFHAMQKAQQAADAERKGMGPGAMIVLLLAIGIGVVVYMNLPDDIKPGGPKGKDGIDPIDDPNPIITMRGPDTDCIGPAQCKQAALDAYSVGVENLEAVEADIINLYEGYKRMELAEAFVEKAKLAEAPAEMRNVGDVKVRAAEAMRDRFLKLRARYMAHEDRKEFEKMADTLDEILAYYPDDRLNYHRWAKREILKMKEDNNYPRRD